MVQLGTCGECGMRTTGLLYVLMRRHKEIVLYKENLKRNRVFTTNSDFQIPISLQPVFLFADYRR